MSLDIFNNQPPRTTYNKLPTLTHRPSDDIPKLLVLNKTTLLKLCESDTYVFELCNTDDQLYHIITSTDDIN
ncbi:MAG TPA: hypothetical protein VLG50_05425 [Candidatus Saccharimonadales bacterium]|nr:hypothetical protein [Candidatus Saccharimonadales bacterium]